MKNILIFILLLISFNSFSIECEIKMKKVSLSDTLYYTYSIKNEYIRIDEYNKYNKLQKSIITNSTKSYTYIDHSEKKYIILNYNNINNSFYYNTKYESYYNDNYKYIINYKCNQWIIKDKKHDRIITLWMTENDKFNQMKIYLPIIPSINETYSYLSYVTIPGVPLQIEVKNIFRYDIENIYVTNIDYNIKIDDSKFKLPIGYKKDIMER